MKRLIILFVVIALAGCSKTEPETTLTISFTQNPSGGNNTTSVSAQYKGNLNFIEGTGLLQPAGEPEPITATVKWWWENFSGGGDQIVKSEMVTFDSETSTTKSATYEANPGYILMNYYWVEIHWTDDDGSHSIQSSKAFCAY